VQKIKVFLGGYILAYRQVFDLVLLLGSVLIFKEKEITVQKEAVKILTID